MLHKEEEYISGERKKKENEKYFKLERELTVLEIRDGRNYRCGCFQLSGVGLLKQRKILSLLRREDSAPFEYITVKNSLRRRMQVLKRDGGSSFSNSGLGKGEGTFNKNCEVRKVNAFRKLIYT